MFNQPPMNLQAQPAPAPVPQMSMSPFNMQANTQAMVEQARAVAEVQVAVMIAQANPRNEQMSIQRILNACSRFSLANRAVYSYNRGGADVSGPSIRLAEALAQNWGNVQYGLRELTQGDGYSEVEAYAWDIETNTRRATTFVVKHKRDTRRGAVKLTDGRDIYEMIANQGARRLRNCILSLIPGDIVDMAVEQCKKTLATNVDMSPAALKQNLDEFAKFGVTREMIEARFGRAYEAITPAQVVQLWGIYQSIMDGLGTPADFFDMGQTKDKPAAPAQSQTLAAQPAQIPAAPQAQGLNNKVMQALKMPQPSAPSEPPAKAQPAPSEAVMYGEQAETMGPKQ